MTREEYVGDVTDVDKIAVRKTAHAQHVKQAVKDGENVPLNVLHQYRNNQWAQNAIDHIADVGKMVAPEQVSGAGNVLPGHVRAKEMISDIIKGIEESEDDPAMRGLKVEKAVLHKDKSATILVRHPEADDILQIDVKDGEELGANSVLDKIHDFRERIRNQVGPAVPEPAVRPVPIDRKRGKKPVAMMDSGAAPETVTATAETHLLNTAGKPFSSVAAARTAAKKAGLPAESAEKVAGGWAVRRANASEEETSGKKRAEGKENIPESIPAAETKVTIRRYADGLKRYLKGNPAVGKLDAEAKREWLHEFGRESHDTGRKLRYEYELSDGRIVSAESALKETNPEAYKRIMERRGEFRSQLARLDVFKALSEDIQKQIVDEVDVDEIVANALSKNKKHPAFETAIDAYLKDNGSILAGIWARSDAPKIVSLIKHRVYMLGEAEMWAKDNEQDALEGWNKANGKHVDILGSPVALEKGGKFIVAGEKSERFSFYQEHGWQLAATNGADALIEAMDKEAEPFRELEFTPENWRKEFGADLTVQTPIGSVKMGEHQYEKLAEKGREAFFGLIRPTLERPGIVVKDKSGVILFFKTFGTNGKRRYSVITINADGLIVAISSYPIKAGRIKKAIEEGTILTAGGKPFTGTNATAFTLPKNNAQSPGGETDGKRNDTTEPAGAQGAGVAAYTGNETIVRANGDKIPARYALVELEDLKASHTFRGGLHRNEGYPEGLQPRDYAAGSEEEAKVIRFATEQEAREYLSDSAYASTGAPTVAADGTVINGNGRVMSLEYASKSSLKWYVDALAERAEWFGLRPEDVRAMTHPVLVRMVDMAPDSKEAVAFARAGNVSTTQAQTPVREAAALRGMIDAETFEGFDISGEETFSEAVNGNSGAANAFRKLLYDKMLPAMRSRYFTEDGNLNDSGKELVRAMLVTKVVPVDVYESIQANRKQLARTLEGAIPQLMALGDTPYVRALNAALEFMARNFEVRKIWEAESLLGQADMFGGEEKSTSLMMVEFILNDGGRPKVFRDKLIRLMGEIESRNGLFAGVDDRSMEEIAAEILGVKMREGAFADYVNERMEPYQVERLYGGKERAIEILKRQIEIAKKDGSITLDAVRLLRELQGGKQDEMDFGDPNAQMMLFERLRDLRSYGILDADEMSDADLKKAAKALVELVREQQQLSLDLEYGEPARSEHDRGGQAVVRPAARGKDTSVLARQIAREVSATGLFEYRGTKIRTAQDLATVAQCLRDNRLEHFHYVFLDVEGRIVGHETVSSGLVGSCAFQSSKRSFPKVVARAKKLGATQIAILHNHPSGDATPSNIDSTITVHIARRLQKMGMGFFGHVVLDHGTYAFITATGSYSGASLDKAPRSRAVGELRHLIGMPIRNYREFVETFEDIQNEPDTVSLVYTDSRNGIAGIQRVPQGIFNDLESARDYLFGRAREFGASRVLACADKASETVQNNLKDLVWSGDVLDVVSDGRSLRSILGITVPSKDMPGIVLAPKKPARSRVRFSTVNSGSGLELNSVREVRDPQGRLLAPNGKPSNLNEHQWKVVRTAAFKKWFGDWEAAHQRAFLEGEPVIRLRGDEVPRFDKFVLLSKWVGDLYKNKYGGKIKNPVIGDVLIDETSARSSVGHGLSKAKAAAFAAIPDVIQNGKIIHSGEKNGVPGIYIAAPISIGGERYVAIAIVRQTQKQRFYLHEVVLTEKLQDASKSHSSEEASAANPGAIRSVLQKVFSVNFGDVSKVVDENGEPMVVYHGTWSPGFNSFSGASYFAASPEYAEKFSGASQGESAGIYPVFLSAKKTLDISSIKGSVGWRGFIEAFREHGISIPEEVAEVIKWVVRGEAWEYTRVLSDVAPGWLDRNGYDGIVQLERTQPREKLNKSFVVFRSNQIKSATGNRGTFDAENPDIRFSANAGKPRGMKRGVVHAATRELFRRWKNGPKDVVVQSVDDLPEDIREEARAQEGIVRGAYDPDTDTVYLIADGLTDAHEAAFVAIHEVVGHRGIEAIVPAVELNAFYRRAFGRGRGAGVVGG
jgi:hypothetical protein